MLADIEWSHKQKAPLPAVTENEAKSSSGVSSMPKPNRIIGFSYRKAESYDSNAIAPFHAADKCILQKARKSKSSNSHTFLLVQLLPRSPNVACYASDGSGGIGCMGH